MSVTVHSIVEELLAADLPARTVLEGDGSLAREVHDATHDSRLVAPGFLFCCVLVLGSTVTTSLMPPFRPALSHS